MITDVDVNRFATNSLKDPRLLRVLSAALEAVDPFDVVQKELPVFDRPVFGLGIGKAAIPMMDALAARVPLAGGLAVTKFAPRGTFRSYTVIEGGHPVPDARSLYAGQEVLKFVSSLNEDDLLICLISGGGSALVTSPDELISLGDLRSLTSLLLSCGARIDEINTIRRQLDRIKGGGLAHATKAKIISLILSDVIGNPLEAIASGPTAYDPTTSADALAILDKYFATESRSHEDSDIINSANELLSGSEKIRPKEFDGSRVQNIIIGDNRLAAAAAMQQAQHEGFHSAVLTNELQGEAREIGVRLARQLKDEVSNHSHPFCWVAGGETTVTIKGNGKGGRNQELALAAVEELRDVQNAMLISLATDGDDGPTDAAGAVVTGATAQRAESLGIRAPNYLSQNDAYPFFEALGDLLKTGPTGTNVNDLIFLIGGVV